MNFDYHDGSSQSSQLSPVSLLELATNVATDWVPGTPTSLTLSFVDLLDAVLEPRAIGSASLWAVRMSADRFEKQWKQVTSWVLGIAFCRKVLEMKEYPWWAPVSAFRRQLPDPGPYAPYFAPHFVDKPCRIRRPDPPLSRLMPDYVVARFDPVTSKYQVSFAESKGTDRSLERRVNAPTEWRQQAHNAEFLCDGQICPPTQNLVVATRINPSAKGAATRRIYVRAWNRLDPSGGVPLPALRAVVRMHYLGVCERLGFAANARLLAFGTLREHEVLQEGIQFWPANESVRARLREDADRELLAKEVWLPGEAVVVPPGRNTFPLGHRALRIGLSRHAVRLISWLLEDATPDEGGMVEAFASLTGELQSLVEDPSRVFVRSDGVVGALVE